MKIDFRKFAQGLAMRDGLQALEPAIEKEVIHYEILQSLSRHGLLNSLTFQGGTCLRLCYASERYSEDLDFAAGNQFDQIDLDAFTRALRADLLKAYDVSVRVKEPKVVQDFSGVGMRRWTVVVDTASERPDIPAQRIKLEVASVPSHTSVIRQVTMNYSDLPASYGQTLVRCQSLGEIMADKLIFFAATDGYIRHRDLWDIPWLSMLPQTNKAEVPTLVQWKHGEYGCDRPLASMLAIGCLRAQREMEGPLFQGQMRRFLSPETYERTVADKDYRSVMLQRVTSAYENVAKVLELEDEVERELCRHSTDALEHSVNGAGLMRGKTI